MPDEIRPLELRVRIEKDLPVVVPDSISFETGATRAQTMEEGLWCYEHHGEDFLVQDRGALSSFFEDLILGRQLPLNFATPEIRDIDTLLAITLFLRRDVALHPMMPSLVANVDFCHRLGLPALAHVDPDLARFLQFLRGYLLEENISKREFGDRLSACIQWVIEYVMSGDLPHLGAPPEVTVLDQGSNGFCVAEVGGSVLEGWIELFRAGFLRGVAFTREGNNVLAARKSTLVGFDLSKACHLLNELEAASGGSEPWACEGDFLASPELGTCLSRKVVLDVLVRV